MNNFDQSSSGENIEFDLWYDLDLASIYFHDFEGETSRINFGRDNCAFLIGDAEKPYYSLLDLKAKSKQELFNLCNEYELLGYTVSIDDYNKADYIDDLLKISHIRHYEHIFKNNNWHDISDKIQHDFYISRGYSQGDAVFIVSIDEPITKEKRQYIDNILWDCPITINLNVNGQEFTESDLLDDYYCFNIDSVKEKINNLPISNYAKAWIIDNLDEPRYL